MGGSSRTILMRQLSPLKIDHMRYDRDGVSGLSPEEIGTMSVEDAALQLGFSVYREEISPEEFVEIIGRYKSAKFRNDLVASVRTVVPGIYRELCYYLPKDLVGDRVAMCPSTCETADQVAAELPWGLFTGKEQTLNSEDLWNETQVIDEAREEAENREAAFIPSNYGILLSPEGSVLFSHNKPGGVYTIPYTKKVFNLAETSGVYSCAVATIMIGEYVIMIHTIGTPQLEQMVAYGLQLADRAGADLEGEIKVRIFLNSNPAGTFGADPDGRNYDDSAERFESYIKPLRNMSDKLGIRFVIGKTELMSENSRITIRPVQ